MLAILPPVRTVYTDFSYLLEVLGHYGPMGIYVVLGFNYISVSYSFLIVLKLKRNKFMILKY